MLLISLTQNTKSETVLEISSEMYIRIPIRVELTIGQWFRRNDATPIGADREISVSHVILPDMKMTSTF